MASTKRLAPAHGADEKRVVASVLLVVGCFLAFVGFLAVAGRGDGPTASEDPSRRDLRPESRPEARPESRPEPSRPAPSILAASTVLPPGVAKRADAHSERATEGKFEKEDTSFLARVARSSRGAVESGSAAPLDDARSAPREGARIFASRTNDLPGEILEAPEGMVVAAGLLVRRGCVTNAEFAAWTVQANRRAAAPWSGGVCPRGEEDAPVRGVFLKDAEAFALSRGERLATRAELARIRRELVLESSEDGARGGVVRGAFRTVKDVKR